MGPRVARVAEDCTTTSEHDHHFPQTYFLLAISDLKIFQDLFQFGKKDSERHGKIVAEGADRARGVRAAGCQGSGACEHAVVRALFLPGPALTAMVGLVRLSSGTKCSSQCRQNGCCSSTKMMSHLPAAASFFGLLNKHTHSAPSGKVQGQSPCTCATGCCNAKCHPNDAGASPAMGLAFAAGSTSTQSSDGGRWHCLRGPI